MLLLRHLSRAEQHARKQHDKYDNQDRRDQNEQICIFAATARPARHVYKYTNAIYVYVNFCYIVVAFYLFLLGQQLKT